MDNEFKDDREYQAEATINCRRNSSYHVETVYLRYLLRKDGTRFYRYCNGCEQLDGSEACQQCTSATPDFLFRHPDTDIKKPFLPVFESEEKW